MPAIKEEHPLPRAVHSQLQQADPRHTEITVLASYFRDLGIWRAEADETENYTYAIALQNEA